MVQGTRPKISRAIFGRCGAGNARHPARRARAIQVDGAGEKVAESLKELVGAIQECLNVGTCLVEASRIIPARQGHLDGDNMQPHDRLCGSWSRCLGKLERAVDYLEALVSLLTKPKMIGICQISLQVRFSLSGEGEVEDRFEVDFDRLDLPIDPLLDDIGNVRRPQYQGSLGLLEQCAHPRDPRRGELIGFTEVVDLAEHGAHFCSQASGIRLDADRERHDTQCGHPIDRIRLRSNLDRTGLLKRLIACRLIARSFCKLCAHQEPPDRRCFFLFEDLEMPPHIGHVGRAVFKGLKCQHVVRIEILRLDLENFLGPIVRFGHEVIAKRVLEQLKSGALYCFIKLDRAFQVIVPLVQERRSLVVGRMLGPIAIETGEFVVNRGVLGVELKRLFEVDLGLLETPSIVGHASAPEKALR